VLLMIVLTAVSPICRHRTYGAVAAADGRTGWLGLEHRGGQPAARSVRSTAPLFVWIEGTVLLLGIAAMYLTVRSN